MRHVVAKLLFPWLTLELFLMTGCLPQPRLIAAPETKQPMVKVQEERAALTSTFTPTSIPTDTATNWTEPTPAWQYQPSGEGVGVLGDSNYDEYHGSDRRGGNYARYSLNSIEQLAILRQVNFGRWGNWGEPRREGFEYVWARSSATSESMIADGQVDGVVKQIEDGKVRYVFIGIGANDFQPFFPSHYSEIYNGEISGTEITDLEQGILANLIYTLDSVQKAGAKGITVILFPQWEGTPQLADLYPDAEKRTLIQKTIDEINRRYTIAAKERGVDVVDQQVLVSFIQKRVDQNWMLDFGGVHINLATKGDEPHNARLGDEAGHAGTVIRGMMVNYYFIPSLQKYFPNRFQPLTDAEILKIAGLQ